VLPLALLGRQFGGLTFDRLTYPLAAMFLPARLRDRERERPRGRGRLVWAMDKGKIQRSKIDFRRKGGFVVLSDTH
jgi:hypothetical protein